MRRRIDGSSSGVRRRAPWLAAVSLAAGCASHSGSNPCASPDGTYLLAVAPTGQSGNLEGTCSTSAPAQEVEISLSGGRVSLNGENCLLCSTSSCQMDVLCGQSVTCPGSAVPVANPPNDYVQTVSFELPVDQDASTPNAVVELGPAYCGYSGTASVAPP